MNILSGVNAGRAQFCFDRTISLPNANGNTNAFRLGGYRWDTFLSGATGTAPVLDSTGKCAIINMFPGNAGQSTQFSRDLHAYTIGTVDQGAVIANQSGGGSNLADSAPNVDSVTKNGTRGHTTSADLQSAITGSPAGTNEIIYLMDQPVDPNTINPNFFCYYDTAGNIFCGQSAQVQNDPNGGQSAVRVQFALPSGTTTQSAAVIATIRNGANNPNTIGGPGQDNAPEPATEITTQSVDNPQCASSGCTTSRPKLISNEISGTNTMDFTFDQPVSATSTFNASLFRAIASNGDETVGTSAVFLTGSTNTVRVTFSGNANVSLYTEEIVQGAVQPGAVQSSNGTPNYYEGKPAGDNANGQAPGYTNGPDATLLTLFKSSGQAVVQFDQRVAANSASQPVLTQASQGGTTTTPTDLSDWAFLDANGNVVAHPTSATVEHVTAYIDQVRLTIANPTLINNGAIKALEIIGNQYCAQGAGPNTYGGGPTTNGGTGQPCGAQPGNPYDAGYLGNSSSSDGLATQSAVYTYGSPHGAGANGMNPAGNVQQILAPASTSALVLKKTGWVKVKTHHAKKHHSKKHHKSHKRG